jgi:5-methylcytosine-specific restriction endonuclease McrA
MKAKQLIRENFRTEVFKRDGHKCRVCKKSGELDAHHITDRNEIPNGGYVKENGISLCDECHLKAEQYHVNGTWSDGFHPVELYKLIGSSHEKAHRASLNL